MILADLLRFGSIVLPRVACAGIALAALGAIAHAAGVRVSEPIRAVVPATDVPDPVRVLGRSLFHDSRLSGDDTVSCASCHVLRAGGDDARRVSIGIGGVLGLVNAPTVFHADQHFRQFWDGRARDLHQQIDGPVQNAREMGAEWPNVVAKLYADPAVLPMFESAFGEPVISRARIKDALAGFMRTLRTTGGAFDRWLLGDDDALSELELRGYERFKHYGCVSCHQGQAVGGNLFQLFGVLNEYFKERAARGGGEITEGDYGRYNVTGAERDRHVFKVPSLRMVVHTAPYLHDGTALTLRDAVDAMFRHQLGREAPDSDKEAIVVFLRTLAGEHPELGDPDETGALGSGQGGSE